ncbi:MAG: hypothetical protein HYX42_04115 [Polaromonas sp.]|uniref:hypothetical protein n=1 Tax=Polaromonas sp. TaxID=1869339 RepID=UPI0025DDA5F5|nr:hypothetical protein [Polaromonas sp.]MBI2725415.1 hypothetical protein [Polaromonas sp.]
MTTINLPIEMFPMPGDTGFVRTCRRNSRQSTSTEAYESVRPHINAKCQKVLDSLKAAPATDEELQIALGMNPSTERPRRKELVDAGLVVETAERRKTLSGCKAIVWAAAPVMEDV